MSRYIRNFVFLRGAFAFLAVASACFIVPEAPTAYASVYAQQLTSGSSYQRVVGQDVGVSLTGFSGSIGSMTFILAPVTVQQLLVDVYKNGSYVTTSGINPIDTATTSRTFNFGTSSISFVSSDTLTFLIYTSGSQPINVQGSYVSGSYNGICTYPVTACSPAFYPYFILDSSSTPTYDTRTRIDSFVPINNSTTSTSTSFLFSAQGYVNADDFVDGMYLRVHYANRYLASQNVVGVYASTMALQKSEETFIFPINSSGAFSLSTTTNLQYVGTYNAQYSLVTPNLFFFTSTLIATSSQFVVSTTTDFDNLTQAVIQNARNFSASNCSFSNFQVFGCLSYLILPSPADMTILFNQLHDQIFTKFPFGYLTRFATILHGNVSPVEPPNIHYTFGSSSPSVLAGSTVDIDIWGNLAKAQSIKADDGSNKNVFDIIDPVITLIVGSAVVLFIIMDLSGIELDVGGSSSGGVRNIKDTNQRNPRGERIYAQRRMFEKKPKINPPSPYDAGRYKHIKGTIDV